MCCICYLDVCLCVMANVAFAADDAAAAAATVVVFLCSLLIIFRRSSPLHGSARVRECAQHQ